MVVYHLCVFSYLDVDRQTVDVIERFANGFVNGGMRVNGAHHGLDRGFRFHRRHRFGDQFVSFRPNDVDAQNLAVFRVGNHFDKAFVLIQDSGFAIAHERKLADFHVEALRAGLRFRQADAADAGSV